MGNLRTVGPERRYFHARRDRWTRPDQTREGSLAGVSANLQVEVGESTGDSEVSQQDSIAVAQRLPAGCVVAPPRSGTCGP